MHEKDDDDLGFMADGGATRRGKKKRGSDDLESLFTGGAMQRQAAHKSKIMRPSG